MGKLKKDVKEIRYMGYCTECQKYVFFYFKRKLSTKETSRWRKCPECKHLSVFKIQLASEIFWRLILEMNLLALNLKDFNGGSR